MDFRWPWEHDETIVLIVEEPAEERDAYLRQLFRRLRHIAEQNDEILDLLRPPVAQEPVSVTLLIQGADMPPVNFAPGQAVPCSYTEQNADGSNVDQLVGTPSWSVPDGNVASIVDNGDGTATLTAVGEGATSVDLSVTLPSGNVLSASDGVTVAVPVPEPTAVTIVEGAPA